MPGDNTVVTEEITISAEKTTQELVPMMATRCGNECPHLDKTFDHSENDGYINVYWCDDCEKYVRVNAG